MRLRFTALLAALTLVVGASTGWAQSQTGEVFGKVTDTSGAVLPGVTFLDLVYRILVARGLAAGAAVLRSIVFPEAITTTDEHDREIVITIGADEGGRRTVIGDSRWLRDGEASTAEEIRGFCRGQIAHYKVPRYVKFVDGFPMTVTGKIQKFVMRRQTIEELGLNLEETA